jgi:hypothetical protein
MWRQLKMQNNKLRMAIRATAAVAVMGVASQAGAVNLSVGDDVEASLYGYARLNMTYDLNDNRAVSTRAGSFSPANEDIEGHFGADVQQSRLGIKVNHASGVAITVEGDFRGSGSSPGSLRMRHAYGEYKGLMAGRNWSNYISFVGYTRLWILTAWQAPPAAKIVLNRFVTPPARCPSLSRILARK